MSNTPKVQQNFYGPVSGVAGNVEGNQIIHAPTTPAVARPQPDRPARSLTLFFSYAHKDEALRDQLATHLALLTKQGILTTWHDRNISAGTEWADAIATHLHTADLILLLISADFIHSNYCYDTEMQQALQRHQQGQARVIPILLRPCDWETSPFGKLQALPIAHGAGAKPVTQWNNLDEAFTKIAQGIRQAAAELTQP